MSKKEAKRGAVDVIAFSCTAQEKAEVQRIAREEERTVSAVVRRMFRAALAARQQQSAEQSATTPNA